MSELERLVCTECGGDLQLDPDRKRGVCRYCRNEYFFKEEKGPALVLALNNAAGYLKRNDFDNAIVHYESVLKEYPKDSEAAWGHVMSTYGIVFAKDDRTGQMIPTCSRIVKESILENRSYKQAIAECAPEQKEIYERKASLINKIQNRIKRVMEDEEDFDVFISFKASDENGIATEDSVIARNIYDELKKRGIKTFFSEVTLRDRIGDEFEPIIYRALYSCKFFILVSTKEEFLNAPWVKNEWTRFRDRVMDEGLNGACTAVFKNLSPYALPRVFQNQGVELEKHPFDYAQLVADNLSTKFGLNSKEKELERKNAELEEKLKKLEEAQKNTPQPAGAMDQNTFAEMMKQFEAEKKRKAEEEAKRKAEEEAKRKAAEEAKRIVEAEAKRKAAVEAKRKAEEEAKRKAAEEAKRKAEEEAKRKAEEEAKRKAAEEAKRKAEEELRKLGFKIKNNCLVKYSGNSNKVVIPSGVTSIGVRAFEDCKSLTSIEIPDSVTSIGYYAFSGCASLTSVVIGDSVTSIGYDAFSNCTSLTSVVIPDSVTSIGYYAFYYCTSLTSIEIPDGVTSIGAAVFRGCSGLTSIEIPDSVTNIGEDAFSGCTSLRSVVIPGSVTSIGNHSFWNCGNITSIEIPAGVTSVGTNAFYGCKSLTRIVINDSEKINAWDKNWNPDNIPIFDGKTGRQLKKNILGKWK